MKKKLVTAYFPCHNPTNQYTQNVQRLIRMGDMEVVGLRAYVFPLKKFFRTKIFNFNWLEDCFDINAPTPFKVKLKYLRMSLFLTGLKLLGKKIVWTMHNKVPHEDNFKRKYKIKLMKKLTKCADAIVVHCYESALALRDINPKVNMGKLKLINHPNYIYNYPIVSAENLRDKFSFKSDDKVFMFFGQIRKYKNIELLIKAFNELNLPKAKLLIAGRAQNQEYREELEALIDGNENIVLNSEFIPDEEMLRYYNTADFVVLPYNKESSLNSGAAYLSFSLKKTVVCPKIGTMTQLRDNSFAYSYDYKNEEEHLVQLKNAIDLAYTDAELNADSVRLKGEAAYNYMLTEHSDDKISEDYKKLYYKITGRKMNE